MGSDIASVVQSILGSVPGLQQPLVEAGLDSLGAVELKNALSSRFSLPNLPASLVFDYTSIEAIAGYLAGMLPQPYSLQSLIPFCEPI